MSWKFKVAGVQFRPNYKEAVKKIEEGDAATLEAEPTNKFDPNAVKIVCKGFFIGYVPKKFSSDISAFLEYAENPTATLTSVIPSAKPWDMFEVEVKDA
jgi:hypothetical protein